MAAADPFDIRCNLCSCSAEGIAYTTMCSHLLCLGCAKKAFSGAGRSCPVCSTVLNNKSELRELPVGIPCSTNITDSIMQGVFSTKDWSVALRNFSGAMESMRIVQDFINIQLQGEATKAKHYALSLTTEMKQKDIEWENICNEKDRTINAYESTLQSLEADRKSREMEHSELKHVYKESQRKCNAWEKAYSSLRNQLPSSGLQRMGKSDANNALSYNQANQLAENPARDSYQQMQQLHIQQSLRQPRHPSIPSQQLAAFGITRHAAQPSAISPLNGNLQTRFPEAAHVTDPRRISIAQQQQQQQQASFQGSSYQPRFQRNVPELDTMPQTFQNHRNTKTSIGNYVDPLLGSKEFGMGASMSAFSTVIRDENTKRWITEKSNANIRSNSGPNFFDNI